jgi:hypothetical protein
MAKEQQRQVQQPKNQMALMTALESKSDEELAAEVRFRSLAQTILGQRAAQRFDSKAARAHFQKALAAARPQERTQIRRMADVFLAMAEGRTGDLKAAADRVGMELPGRWPMLGLRLQGFIAPPASAGSWPRARGIIAGLLLVIALIAALWGVPFGILSGVDAATGGISVADRSFYAIAAALLLFIGLIVLSRRRGAKAKAKQAEMLAERQTQAARARR